MTRAIKLYEAELYNVWQNKSFENPLQSGTGQKIEIIDPGELNKDSSGPDFKNARVKIDDITYVGDVEIERDYNDWKHHGHNIDKKYNKVILHVCFLNKYRQNYVYNKEGRKIISICLSDYIDEEEVKEINRKIEASKEELSHRLRCIELADKIPFGFKKRFLAELGIKRFEKKTNRIFERLKELKFLSELKIKEPKIGYELTEEFNSRNFSAEEFQDPALWEQLFYEFIFEALGYSKNKNIMLKLARSANLNFIKRLSDKENFIELAEAALYGIGGLLPNVNGNEKEKYSEYTLKLNEDWENIKKIYDGEVYSETDWHFFKLRPQNFPTIRIAGGVRFLKELLFNDLISRIVKKIIEIRSLSVLMNSLKSLFIIKSGGYWKRHYTFDNSSSKEIKYFVGLSRADEMVVNVVLPFLALYFKIFGKENAGKKVMKIYQIYSQNSDNRITREVAENLDVELLLKKSIYSQGMIELFRSYCSKNKCLECKLGEQIFN